MIRCPRCACELKATVTWYDDEDGPRVELDAVPLTNQPCTSREAPTVWGVRWPYIGWVKGCEVGFSVCNWLGDGCNIASHVTPVTRDRHMAALPVLGFFDELSCTYVNASSIHDAIWVAPGLARCVQ